MKKFYVLATLLMAATPAHAGNSISFEIDGHKIRIEAPKHCDRLTCLQISGFDLNGFKAKGFDNNDDVAVKPEQPAQTPAPAPTVEATPQQTPAAPVTGTAPASTTVAPTLSAPAIKDDVAATAPAASTIAKPAPVAAAPVPMPVTPLGVWATEENKGNVRIEPCGEASADTP
jgi:hypothetical protein